MAKIRISAGNLAVRVRVDETNEAYFFGLLNKKAFLEKGRFLITALGGAAEMTPLGKKLLESRYGAEFQEGMDARFVIDESHLEDVLRIFESRDSSLYETDATREVREELATKELPILDSPVLSEKEMTQVKVVYVKTARQQSSGATGTSAREGEIPTRRIFNLFEIVVPKAIFEKIAACPAVKILTPQEIATTRGGASKGRAADGAELGDNLIW